MSTDLTVPYPQVAFILKNVLGIDIEKFIQWLGYLFEWNDIIAVKDGLVNLVNTGLDAGAQQLEGLAGKVDQWFEGVEDKIRGATYPEGMPSQAGTKSPDSSGDSPASNANSSCSKSPSVNWSSYQWDHGMRTCPLTPSRFLTVSLILSTISGGVKDASIGTKETTTTFGSLEEDIIKPLLDTFKTEFVNIGNDILPLFHPDNGVSIEDMLKKTVGDIAIGFVDVVRVIAVGLIKLGAAAIEELKDLINYEITIPVLSWLYEKISGKPLTVLDGLALLVGKPLVVPRS